MAAEGHALRRELDELLVSNAKLEDELHSRGACSDAILGQLRSQAFIDVLVAHLGIETEFALEVEKQRAEAAATIMAQMDRAKLAVPGGAIPLRPDGR